MPPVLCWSCREGSQLCAISITHTWNVARAGRRKGAAQSVTIERKVFRFLPQPHANEWHLNESKTQTPRIAEMRGVVRNVKARQEG